MLISGNDGSNALQGSGADDVIYGFDPAGPQAQVSTISATRVASGLTQPLFVSAAADDVNRLFVVEKTGAIKILDLATDTVLDTPFLDLSSQISTAGEGGLLGLAFDRDFAANGFFYVNLTNPNGDTDTTSHRRIRTQPIRAARQL